MKKLIIGLAAAALCVSAEAVVVRWNSGSFMNPDTDGSLKGVSWNGSKWTFDTAEMVASPAIVHAYLWESTSDLSFKSGDLIKWYDAGAKGTPFAGIETVTKDGTSSAMLQSTKDDWENKDNAYAAVLYVLTQGDKTWYQENDLSVVVGNSMTTLNLISDFVGGGAINVQAQTLNKWQAVPEPFSGTLALLGMGVVALRRKMKKQKKA